MAVRAERRQDGASAWMLRTKRLEDHPSAGPALIFLYSAAAFRWLGVPVNYGECQVSCLIEEHGVDSPSRLRQVS